MAGIAPSYPTVLARFEAYVDDNLPFASLHDDGSKRDGEAAEVTEQHIQECLQALNAAEREIDTRSETGYEDRVLGQELDLVREMRSVVVRLQVEMDVE